jgi:hypothetical protein
MVGSSDRPRLAASARGQSLLMLPNDTLLQPGCLGGLIEMAQQHEKIMPRDRGSADIEYQQDGIVCPRFERWQAPPKIDSDEPVWVRPFARRPWPVWDLQKAVA